jgi:predicted component of type VI protein secretion system
MAKFTISAAARLCHMDRRTLQRAIHAGRLHLDAQHCLSTDELILAGYLIADTPQEEPQVAPHGAPQETPLVPLLERLTSAIESLLDEVRQFRTDLRQAPHGAPQAAPQRGARPRVSTPQAPPLATPQTPPQFPPQDAPQTATSPPGSYDPDVAYARIRGLQAQGLTQRQIAAQLTADGVPTRQGGPWGQSSVRYLLQTRGR